MKMTVLNASTREVTGKKVKKLRREGLIPVSVYGKEVKSMALSVSLKEFMTVYSKVGETGLVELKFEGKAQPTLVANVQIHPVTRAPLHVEFRAVKLTEKIKAKVPVELVGESPAVVNNIGVLLSTLSEIEVEALPADLPDKVEVDVTSLLEVNQQVTVGELSLPKSVEVLTSKEEIVVKVASAVSEETQKELAAEEAAKVAEEGSSEAAPVGGEGEASKDVAEKASGEKEEKKE